jgi:galactofuranosylgalactofuranosylrhamnosyl-N-acetylglucosaminyl-diphospho-decaprenol beta-1,5/1,6-galactofuranosyltransferase
LAANFEQFVFQDIGKMKFINLQAITLPDQRVCMEDQLYFRLDDEDQNVAHYDALGRKLIFPKYARSAFDTYFNSFSFDKWKQYTRLNSLHLRLSCRGKFVLRVVSSFLNDTQAVSSLICLQELAEHGENLIEIPVAKIKGSGIFFELQALEDNAEFQGGGWCTSVEEHELNPSKMALIICTHHREEYVRQNVELINEQLFKTREYSLKDDLHIYIVDNGRSLDVEKYASPNIRVIPNINAGGAGGFARGMLAAHKDQKKHGLTHILLMDDDVRVEPESIARTLSFLKLLKPEFADAFIGGSMLRLDEPGVMFESGAVFGTQGYHALKSNLDVGSWENVLLNDIAEPLNYFAWWYCVIPMSIGLEGNLPLPLFMRLDDVEFGLRNMRHGIALNGISIWHEPFERRHSSTVEYYFVRNFMIVMAGGNVRSPAAVVISMLLRKIVLALLHYDYDQCNQIFDAIEDYYKGLDWLTAQDPEKLHARVSSRKAVFQDIQELDFDLDLRQYFDSLEFQDQGLKRFFRRITFNGYILPTNRDIIITNDISQGRKRIGNMYRAKRVMQYDITCNRGAIFERSLSRALLVAFRFVVVSIKLFFTLQSKNNEYRKKLPFVRTRRFWDDFLKIQQ